MPNQLLLALLIGGCFVLVGLFTIRAREMFWALTNLSLRMRGITAERTDWWYQQLNLRGAFFIVAGSPVIVFALSATR